MKLMYITCFLTNHVFPTMSFHNMGSRRSIIGRGGRGQYLWKHGGDRKIIFALHFDANSNDFTHLTRNGHLYLGPQHATPSHISVPSHVSQDPLPFPNTVEFPNLYPAHNLGWDVLPHSPWANTTGWGNLEPNHILPSISSSTSSGHYEKTPHTTENPPKFVEKPNEVDPIVDNIPLLPSVPPMGCWNIVTSKNILYVSFVVPDGPTRRTTCIILYPDASNRKK